MLKIGITGGMGSGKTTVCKVFETYGVPLYYADDRAKLVMNQNDEVKKKLKALFGDDIYGEDGILNKKRMSEKAFSNPYMLKKLESVIHPAVAEDFEEWANQFTDKPYIVKEAAMLFESGSYKHMDKNILVKADLEERLKRIIKRDNTTREKAMLRIDKQWTDEEKEPLSDYILYNNSETLLLPQIIKLHKLFSRLTTA
ncbi:MAG: dephospho-CoA kinase [Bacteroidia bacterium]